MSLVNTLDINLTPGNSAYAFARNTIIYPVNRLDPDITSFNSFRCFYLHIKNARRITENSRRKYSIKVKNRKEGIVELFFAE